MELAVHALWCGFRDRIEAGTSQTSIGAQYMRFVVKQDNDLRGPPGARGLRNDVCHINLRENFVLRDYSIAGLRFGQLFRRLNYFVPVERLRHRQIRANSGGRRKIGICRDCGRLITQRRRVAAT